MEGERTPNEPPTNRLYLAPEDLDRIAAAIRDGLGKQPPDGRKLFWDVVRVVGAFALLVFVYLALTHWRPAVDVTARANALPVPQVMTHTSEEGDVAWSLGPGEVRTLAVEELPATEPRGDNEFTITLPIPGAECADVASSLNASCEDNVVEVSAPVTVAWSDPQVLQLERAPDTTVDQVTPESDSVQHDVKLDLKQASAEPAGMTEQETDESAEESEGSSAASPLPQLTIADRQPASQRWSFTYQSSAAATLSISGGSAGYQRPYDPASTPEIGGASLQLRVVPGAAAMAEESQDASTTSPSEAAPGETRRASTVVTLAGIKSLNLTTSSTHLDASALTGSLTLLQDTRVFDTATPADVIADEPIRSGLEIESGTPSLAIEGSEVTNIDTGRGNLVSTLWQRHSELVLPIFIGVVGVFTPLLGTVYRNAVDYLANRRSPIRKANHDQ